MSLTNPASGGVLSKGVFGNKRPVGTYFRKKRGDTPTVPAAIEIFKIRVVV